MSQIEDTSYYLGLLPCQFMSMTILELNKFAKQKFERIRLEEEANNRRVARICMIIANVNRDRKKKPKPYTEKDFMPKSTEKRKKMNVKDIATTLKMIAIMHK